MIAVYSKSVSIRNVFLVRFIFAFVPFAIAFGLLAGCGGSSDGEQQGERRYPTDEIEFIVPYSAGGGFDAWARMLVPFIEKNLPGDVSVVVRNVPGGSGQIAAAQLYNAKPDGAQIEIIDPSALAGAQVGGGADFDLREFTYIGRVDSDPLVLFTGSDSDISGVESLKRGSQATPVRQAMSGFTSSDGIALIILYETLGVQYTPIQHEGSSEARLSVIRGDAEAIANTVESTLGELEAGDLKPILIIGNEGPKQGEPGYEETQDVQTLADVGYPELAEGLEVQRVIVAPPNLPEDIKQMLAQAIQAALDDPELLAQAEENDISPRPLDANGATGAVNETLELLSEYEDTIKEALEGIK